MRNVCILDRNSAKILAMSHITRFLINGKYDRLLIDDRHPTFSFVIDFEKDNEHLNKASLTVNNHVIDVSELTHYSYEFDDLIALSTYDAILEVEINDKVEKKIVTFETGLFKLDSPFISDPLYTFKEKHVSPKVMSFKKYIKVLKEVKRARIFVTAFGVYNFYLNNEKINKEYLGGISYNRMT